MNGEKLELIEMIFELIAIISLLVTIIASI